MKTIFFLLFPVLLWGQFEVNILEYEQPYWWVIDDNPIDTLWEPIPETALEFLNRIDKQEYKHDAILDEVGALCPWQSWRLQPYFSYQVDVILSPDEFDAFEPRLLDEDLIFYAMGGNRDGLNITERGYYAQLHVPGLNSPIIKHYDFIFPHWACDFENNNPQWGWHRRILENGMAMAVKELPGGLFHVSMAKFVKHDGY